MISHEYCIFQLWYIFKNTKKSNNLKLKLNWKKIENRGRAARINKAMQELNGRVGLCILTVSTALKSGQWSVKYDAVTVMYLYYFIFLIVFLLVLVRTPRSTLIHPRCLFYYFILLIFLRFSKFLLNSLTLLSLPPPCQRIFFIRVGRSQTS